MKIKDQQLSLTTKAETFKFLLDLIIKAPLTKYRISICEWKPKRSLKANAQYHAWVPDISDFTCTNVRATLNELKLDFGLPIILRDEIIGQRYGERLEKLNFFSLTREELIGYTDNDGKWHDGVMELIQVTSLMNTKQHNQMRDNILYFYNQAGLNIGYDD